MRLFRDTMESSSLEVIQELTGQSPKQPGSNSVLTDLSSLLRPLPA